jgi:putative transposase
MGEETDSMSTKRRKRHSPEQVVRKLRDADAMLNAGKDLAAVLQALEISESAYERWRNQYGGMKAEEAVRLKKLEDENRRLKELVAEKELDVKALKLIAEGNWRALLGSARL